MNFNNYLELDSLLMRDTKLVCVSSTGVERALKKYKIDNAGHFLRTYDINGFDDLRNPLTALELEGLASLLKFKYYGVDMEVVSILEKKFNFEYTDSTDIRGNFLKIIYFGDKRLGNRYEYNNSICCGSLSSLGFSDSEMDRILKDLQLLPEDIIEISLINYFKVAYERYKNIILVNKQSVSLHVFYEKISLYLKYYELLRKDAYLNFKVDDKVIGICKRKERR